MALQNTTPSSPFHADLRAQNKIERAFRAFERVVTTDDSRLFNSTTLRDVRQAALDVERQLAARQSLCNLRRLQPLFESLEHYSKVVEVLCNGTPYLPWIWAPMKLILQLAADYVSAFRQLIDAYVEIADTLPRFDQLSTVFSHRSNFQQMLASYYVGILSFHMEAYKFLRRPAWKLFFLSSWGRFRRQFTILIQDLRRYSDLVDKQASLQAILDADQWREKERERVADLEKERSCKEHDFALQWLHIDGLEQVNKLDSLADSSYPGTCEWILKNQKMKAWVPRYSDLSFLWLTGKPGSGKSVLSSQVVRFLLADNGPMKKITLYHFCTYAGHSGDHSGYIYRSLLGQLLRENDDLLRYVYEEYVLQRKPASVTTVKDILSKLISSISQTPPFPADVRIIVDGLDEYSPQEQAGILKSLESLASSDASKTTCKILVSSRDTQLISRILRKKNTILLNEERDAVKSAIQSFVNSELKRIQVELPYIDLDDGLIAEILRTIVDKSDGMFLWVQLVLQVLQSDVYREQDIKTAVEELPKDLTEFYRILLLRLQKERTPQMFKTACRIFNWIAYAKRPLKVFELLSAIEFHPDNTSVGRSDLPREEIFTICKPFIQDSTSNTLCFVHFTVYEFFLQPVSGPLLQPVRGHCDLALACTIYYLRFGLPLLAADPIPEDRQLIQVVKGYHGLQPYAHEYLIEHLSMIGRRQATLSPSDLEELLKHLHQLCSEMDTMRSSLVLPIQRQDEVRIPIAEDLLYLASNQTVRGFILEELSSREHIRQTLKAGSSPPEMSTKSTILEEISIQRGKLIKSILSVDYVIGVGSDVLQKFQQHYGRSEFHCRYPGCTHAASEFKSDQLRRQHELSFHSVRLNCTDPDCTYGLTFRNRRDLNAHVQKYHTKEASPEIPRSVRRSTRDLQQEYQAQLIKTQPVQMQMVQEKQQQQHQQQQAYQEQLEQMKQQQQQRQSQGQQSQDQQNQTRQSSPNDIQLFVKLARSWAQDVIREEPEYGQLQALTAQTTNGMFGENETHEKPASLPASEKEDIVPLWLDGLSMIKCICVFLHDDGNTVLCERCETWQHIECYYHGQEVPQVHNCVDCKPRPLDGNGATEHQGVLPRLWPD